MKILRYTLVLLSVATCAHGMSKTTMVVKRESKANINISQRKKCADNDKILGSKKNKNKNKQVKKELQKKNVIPISLKSYAGGMVILATYVGILAYKYYMGIPIDFVRSPCTGEYIPYNDMDWQLCCYSGRVECPKF